MGTHPIFESDFDCLTEEFKNMSSHTILLVQPTRKPEGRTYSDYESVNDCMEGVCKIYEEHLKRLNPSSPQITYDISQLFDSIDELADLSCLVYQKNSQTYLPYNKDWVKRRFTFCSETRLERTRNSRLLTHYFPSR